MTKANNPEEEMIQEAEQTVKQEAKPKKTSKKDKELEKAQQQRDEYLSMAQRLQAEFDNYRKRNATLRADSYNEGAFDTVVKFLPVIDDFDRAIEAEERSGTQAGVLDGLKLIRKQFLDILQSMEVTEIPAVGQPFDPNLHEAIATVAEGESGMVYGQMRKGYIMKDKVLRHSIVRVTE